MGQAYSNAWRSLCAACAGACCAIEPSDSSVHEGKKCLSVVAVFRSCGVHPQEVNHMDRATVVESREPLRPTPNSCHTWHQGMLPEPMGFLTWIRVSALFGSRAKSPSAGTVSVLLGPTVHGRLSTSSRAGPLHWIRCMSIFLSRSGLSGNGQQACWQWLAPASHVLAPRPLRRQGLASCDVVAHVLTDLARSQRRGIALVCVGVGYGKGRPLLIRGLGAFGCRAAFPRSQR